MDMVSTLKNGFEGVSTRQKLYHSVSQLFIDRVCEVILETLFQLQLDSNESVFTDLKDKLDSLLPIVQSQESQKELNTSLSKYVKVLDKCFHLDMSRVCRNVDFDIDLVNKVLVHYFYRQGLLEVGDCLVKEAEVEVESEVRSQSLELRKLSESMKLGDIDPAMRWIFANRGELKENSWKLELKLRCLRFCEMLREGKEFDALKYARIHFPQYAYAHWNEIRKLLAALLWTREPEKSPYKEMVSSLSCENVTKELTKEYYHVLNQPSNSPLGVVLSAGLKTVPTLLKLSHVMGSNKEEWELPIPLELGNEFQFHSVFVCPVSRDQSSEENPPMMMPCCHVLCMQSIMRLSKNCRSSSFKCPFCPAITSAAACKQLYF